MAGRCDVGVATGRGQRLSMEDYAQVRLLRCGRGKEAVYTAVFDGHNGQGAARAASHLLHTLLEERLEALEAASSASPADAPMGEALHEAFMHFDAWFKRQQGEGSPSAESLSGGTTALVCVACGGALHVASVGDSRAVLHRASGRVSRLTVDHSPTLPAEALRIGSLGGRSSGPSRLRPDGASRRLSGSRTSEASC